MYGYVVVNKPELKFREFDVYRSYYCGLCRSLGEAYGVAGRISISYDMTFLVMLLTGLYEPEVICESRRCVLHPVCKHYERRSSITQYVADMNLLLAYYKCIDDWKDEHKLTKKVYADGIKRRVKRIEQMYPKKAAVIKEQLNSLSQMENNEESNIDKVSECFAVIMAEIIAMRDDEWHETLRILGYNLGKFVYLLDAYDDLEGDIKKGRYNVLKNHIHEKDFDDMMEGILNAVMAGCARNFEILPIIQDVEILRNIIYSGVWTRFEMAKKRKSKEK